MNIESIFPDALVAHIISFLLLKQIFDVSRTSHIFNRSCKRATKQIDQISLGMYDFVDCCSAINQVDKQTFIAISMDLLKYNKGVNNFLKRIWRNIKCFDSNQYNLIDILTNKMGLTVTALNKIEMLSQPNYSYKHHTAYLNNIEWISIPFIGINIWNKLVSECPRLHGISFSSLCIELSDDMELESAPNLWTLSINSGENCIQFSYIDLINKMLSSAKNLQFVEIQSDGNFTFNPFDVNKKIKISSNLVALKVDFSSLMEMQFDLSSCNKLCYIDLDLSFLTEDIELNEEHHRPLTRLLSSFLDLNIYSTKLFKHIGVNLDYENGTNNVSYTEKIAAILQFKSLMNQNAVYYNKNKLQIISTSYNKDLIEVWTEEIFSISQQYIIRQQDAKVTLIQILQDYYDDIDYVSGIIQFLQKFIDFEILG